MSRVFGEFVQLGYVVRDIQAAMRHWVEVLGVGPWFYTECAPFTDFQYKGRASLVDASIAQANSGTVQVELIQQRNEAPSPYRDFLNAGREGLQHIGYGTRNFDADLKRILQAKYEVGQSGTVSGSQPFVYLLTEAHPGTVVELLDMAGERAQRFARIAEAARRWDGTVPIRSTLPPD